MSGAAPGTLSEQRAAAVNWSLLAGNFAIGCGVMVVPGSLNDLARSLHVSVALAGQLTTLSAATMCVAAPLAAGLVSGFDRRRLLAWTLVWYAAGHAASALMPTYAALLPMRALTVPAAAIFTPQGAAAVAVLAPAHRRGRSITFVFLGWSLASVLGMPLHSFIGETFGWRYAFALVALLSLLGAWGVWRALPDGVRTPAMPLAAWGGVLTHPALMAVVAVTACSAAGTFTVFAYLAPYFRERIGADAAQISFLFFWFGAFGVAGNVLLSRSIDRVGTARAVAFLLAAIASSFVLWPLAGSVASVALVLVPWGFGFFASNSAQQARLGLARPALAPALMSLNTSAIYAGQAAGAGIGGVLVAATGYGWLNWVALSWVLAGIALSAWAQRRLRRESEAATRLEAPAADAPRQERHR